MKQHEVDKLAAASAKVAMMAAAEALKVRGVVPDDLGLMEKVLEALRARVKGAMEEALKDAKEAHDAGMTAVAEATWVATFRLAGIKAVEDVFPKAEA